MTCILSNNLNQTRFFLKETLFEKRQKAKFWLKCKLVYSQLCFYFSPVSARLILFLLCLKERCKERHMCCSLGQKHFIVYHVWLLILMQISETKTEHASFHTLLQVSYYICGCRRALVKTLCIHVYKSQTTKFRVWNDISKFYQYLICTCTIW